MIYAIAYLGECVEKWKKLVLFDDQENEMNEMLSFKIEVEFTAYMGKNV